MAEAAGCSCCNRDGPGGRAGAGPSWAGSKKSSFWLPKQIQSLVAGLGLEGSCGTTQGAVFSLTPTAGEMLCGGTWALLPHGKHTEVVLLPFLLLISTRGVAPSSAVLLCICGLNFS